MNFLEGIRQPLEVSVPRLSDIVLRQQWKAKPWRIKRGGGDAATRQHGNHIRCMLGRRWIMSRWDKTQHRSQTVLFGMSAVSETEKYASLGLYLGTGAAGKRAILKKGMLKRRKKKKGITLANKRGKLEASIYVRHISPKGKINNV